MVEQISLIIPSQNAEDKLLQILSGIPNWKIIPNEIIIIDSSQKELVIPESFVLYAKKNNIRLLVMHKKNLYPGHARNIGISNSTNSLLAFLDTSTRPNKEWLSSGLNLINSQDLQGVWGNTYYQADTFLSKLIRASTYGSKPINTFPGTILEKDAFRSCGLFIESARAGEDGDWISRAELQKVKMSNPLEFLNYDELNNMTIEKLLKKWFRNYIFSGKLPHNRTQKDFYFYFISFIAVVIAYNWNSLLAAWDTESLYYVPNITKISIIIIFSVYTIIRGVILPMKKGVNFRFIFPINFIFISFLSGFLDITKVLAFSWSKFNRQ